jgi:S-methylmethionine-dependent homocysteine/selenocysteine methylase
MVRRNLWDSSVHADKNVDFLVKESIAVVGEEEVVSVKPREIEAESSVSWTN